MSPLFGSLRGCGAVIPPVERDMANPAWEAAAARILIVRLSPWRDVDISTSHIVLFDETRRAMKEAYIDFAFLPQAGDRKILSSRGLPWFYGLVSKRSPADFDLVMISNAFALELVNLPYLFSTAGLSGSAASRAGLDDQPIVIAGGSNASAMGALVLEGEERRYPVRDAFLDGIFFGEGEGAIGELVRILARDREEGSEGAGRRQDIGAPPASGEPDPAARTPPPRRLRTAAARRTRLAAAAEVRGFWPCLLTAGTRRALAPGRPRSVVAPLVLNGPGASSARLTISSGCPAYCSFCLEGWDRRPYREAGLDRLIEEAKEIRRTTGASDLEIYSFNFNTHSRVFDLIFELNRIFRRVSFMSQRLDILAETRGLVEAEMAGGKRSFTLGIEGISSSMRAYYRKGLSDDQIGACLDGTIRPGVKELKLFFIIAGIETQADIAEFSSLMEEIRRKKDLRSPAARILVSAGFLVRLPFTPLQYAPLEFDGERLARLGFLLREACERSGIEFRLAADAEECFVDQALSLAGCAAYHWLAGLPSLGVVYDGSLGAGAWRMLKPLLFGKDADPAFTAEKPADFRPPLHFIEEEKGFALLRRHYVEASRRSDRHSCLGGECSACGVCDDAEDRRAMTGHRLEASSVSRRVEKLEALLSAKTNFQPVYASCYFPEELSAADPAYRMSWLLRTLSAAIEGAETVVFEAREELFVEGRPFDGLFKGEDGRFGLSAVALYGPDAKRTGLLLSRLAAAEAAARGLPPPTGSSHRISPVLLPAAPSPSAADIAIRVPDGGPDLVRGALESYMSDKKLIFTARRVEDGWDYAFPASSAGRKLILAAALREAVGGISMSLSVGRRAGISPLLDAIGKACGTRPRAELKGWR